MSGKINKERWTIYIYVCRMLLLFKIMKQAVKRKNIVEIYC